MVDDVEALAQMERDRAAAAELILGSTHPLRVVVAGPGTGKTYVFKEALHRAGGPGLALTFIKKLAVDLAGQLGATAETYTFHKFAKMLVYRLAVPGLTADFSLYPPFAVLIDADLGLIGAAPPDERYVERQMQELEASVLLPIALRIGTYYDAASFVDVVYRVFQFLESKPARTPAYSLVVVDEYQDFTRLETAFIAQLGFASPLLIAGDDDQALYDFRFASAEHIRALAGSTDAERHELPFCSRCTVPVVAAVNAVIARARNAGLLKGRLEKPYKCYVPEKLDASRRYPQLIEASCTTLRVMARYIENEIDQVPDADVEAAGAGGHPAAMVIGPGYFVEPIYRILKEGRYPQAELRRSEQISVEPLDAYRRLARDESSNLGWRVLIHLVPFPGFQDAIRESLSSGDPLVMRVPRDYRDQHLGVALLVARGLKGETLSAEERRRVATALDVSDGELDEELRRNDDPDDVIAPEALFGEAVGLLEPVGPEPAPVKTILCTTLQGAKGLSAEHVFIVGLMGGHLPRDNASPTDREICEFLVALSRTRTACHLVSARQFGPPPKGRRAPPRLPVSRFVKWVAPQSRHVDVAASDLPVMPKVKRADAPDSGQEGNEP